MSELLFGHDDIVASWVGQITGKPFHTPYTTIGIVRDGELTGAFVFTGFNGDGIELSLAGRGVAARGAWRAVLHYVFDQLGCVRLQMHTRRSNKVVRRSLSRMLPRQCFEGVARRFYGDEDGICFALTRNDLSAFRDKWKV